MNPTDTQPRILISCPPMLGMMQEFFPLFEDKGIVVDTPQVVQTLSESELIRLLPGYDGWIIGDDPATASVLEHGRAGRLRAAVKWGIGTDNIDQEAMARLGIAFTNTPNMFGREVADIALGYTVALARDTFLIDREIRHGGWPKPAGISLAGRTVGLVGYGDIGRNIARRLAASEMNIIVYDPACTKVEAGPKVRLATWPQGVEQCDFLIFACSLTPANRHMLNRATLQQCRQGVRIVNVARGPLINESDLIEALQSGKVCSVALDVMESEPLPESSPLRTFPRCIFGSHNSSNTIDAVRRTSLRAIELLFGFLNP